mmetsp:Transcript_22594/g.33068  ORF Transcript_22594/g.33068 Transcript_22594/m.33068 type:complete len:190 (+) Transcript_22594:72-641(+)|eukprot:CAMPEP_0197259486 /NCGR_PEP_ID=MMETSP1429-20130617/83539_1 /TAXON_ID=49237 /ORGANISM="Chaetoceros  sp., Strain UNC1202" /LENGTH=189 /DNA_ID=CAMNT_0042723693 /DNA_START=57 /DNA_END=626 /DNA_ORIENTATION=-
MNRHLSLLRLLAVFATIASAVNGSTPDNFMFSFKKDLETFGVLKSNDNMVKKSNGTKKEKTKQIKTVQQVATTPSKIMDIDDFERAQEDIFHAVESVEKAVLDVAEKMLHDEVEILFGKDHGHDIHENLRGVQSVSAKGAHKAKSATRTNKQHKKKTVEVKTEEGTQDMSVDFFDLMEHYAENSNQFGW